MLTTKHNWQRLRGYVIQGAGVELHPEDGTGFWFVVDAREPLKAQSDALPLKLARKAAEQYLERRSAGEAGAAAAECIAGVVAHEPCPTVPGLIHLPGQKACLECLHRVTLAIARSYGITDDDAREREATVILSFNEAHKGTP